MFMDLSNVKQIIWELSMGLEVNWNPYLIPWVQVSNPYCPGMPLIMNAGHLRNFVSTLVMIGNKGQEISKDFLFLKLNCSKRKRNCFKKKFFQNFLILTLIILLLYLSSFLFIFFFKEWVKYLFSQLLKGRKTILKKGSVRHCSCSSELGKQVTRNWRKKKQL